MGVPTEVSEGAETRGTAGAEGEEDTKRTSQRHSAVPEEDPSTDAFKNSEGLKNTCEDDPSEHVGVLDKGGDGGSGGGGDDSGGGGDNSLDENANVDFKMERLQLKGLTGDDNDDDNGGVKASVKAEAAEAKDSTSDHHDVTVNGVDSMAAVNAGDLLLTPQDGDRPERGEEEGEAEEEEEEEEPPEMTAEERKASVKAEAAEAKDSTSDHHDVTVNGVDSMAAVNADDLLLTPQDGDQPERGEEEGEAEEEEEEEEPPEMTTEERKASVKAEAAEAKDSTSDHHDVTVNGVDSMAAVNADDLLLTPQDGDRPKRGEEEGEAEEEEEEEEEPPEMTAEERKASVKAEAAEAKDSTSDHHDVTVNGVDSMAAVNADDLLLTPQDGDRPERGEEEGEAEEEEEEEPPEMTAEERKASVKAEAAEAKDSTSDHHDVTVNGVDSMAAVNADDLLLTPQDCDRPERGEEEGEVEEEEEEEEPPEMTTEERKDMHEAVKAGDIDLLEDLLEKPNADINMVYFGQNLLVTALKAEQPDMAEFLLDNGVDHTFATTLMHVGTHSSGTGSNANSSSGQPKKGGTATVAGTAVEVYHYSCRQMAYDRGFLDVVEMIDILNHRLFPGVRPRDRVPRFRKPLPPATPRSSSPSTSSFSSSSSSEDESEVVISSPKTDDAGQDSSFSRSTSKDGVANDGLLAVPTLWTTKKKKSTKTKKKKKTRDEADGRDLPQSENDSAGGLLGGVDWGKKSRKKTEEEQEETEKGSTSSKAVDDDAGSVSRRSGAGRAEGSGNLTDRSRATTNTNISSKGSARGGEGGEEGETGGNDEGYETMSPSPSHPPHGAKRSQQGLRLQQQPSIPVKANKAFLALRRTSDTHRQHCVPAKYNEARPLLWKKVRSTGSYHTESPLWHQQHDHHQQQQHHQMSAGLSPKLPPPTPTGTPTTTTNPVSMLSPRWTGEKSRSQSEMVSGGCLVSTVEIINNSSGNGCGVTQPKILHPAAFSRVQSGKSFLRSSSASSVISGTSSTTFPATTTTTASSSSSVSLSSSSTKDQRRYPLQLRVPGYMRLTASCFVKRRLEPTFTNSYASLDFVETGSGAGPAATANCGLSLRGPGDLAALGGVGTSSRGNGEDSVGLSSVRKSVGVSLNGWGSASSNVGGGGLPSVLDVSASPSPPLSHRKKGGGGGGGGVGPAGADGGSGGGGRGRRGGEGVPNIRNNSSVLHSSKLPPSAKVR